MSDAGLINLLMTSDVGRSTKNNEHLNDLRDRAVHLGKTTGRDPASWYEFKQALPKETPHTLRNFAIGIAAGVGIAAAIGLLVGFMEVLPLALSFGLIGGAVGVFSDTENTRRDEAVKKYEAYLDNFEASIGRAPTKAFAIDKMPPLREGENVARLQQEQPAALTRP